MRGEKTWRYWVMRLELTAGVAVILVTWVTVLLPPAGVRHPMVEHASSPVLSWAPVAFAVMLTIVGLVWMIRIFRGPRDEPPPWRYRDR